MRKILWQFNLSRKRIISIDKLKFTRAQWPVQKQIIVRKLKNNGVVRERASIPHDPKSASSVPLNAWSLSMCGHQLEKVQVIRSLLPNKVTELDRKPYRRQFFCAKAKVEKEYYQLWQGNFIIIFVCHLDKLICWLPVSQQAKLELLLSMTQKTQLHIVKKVAVTFFSLLQWMAHSL